MFLYLQHKLSRFKERKLKRYKPGQQQKQFSIAQEYHKDPVCDSEMHYVIYCFLSMIYSPSVTLNFIFIP